LGETSSFIKANKDKPFLAYLSFYAVHQSIMAPEAVVKKYEEKRKKLGLKDEFAPESPRENRTIYSHAVREGKWKLIRWDWRGRVQKVVN